MHDLGEPMHSLIYLTGALLVLLFVLALIGVA